MLAPWKKSYDQPRHYLANCVPSSQSYGFFQESCMDVRVGPQRKLSAEVLMLLNWCWRRLLRVPWTARISKQSILKEISPEYSLEGLMLKLKLQSLATWCKELTHLQWLCWWERFKARGEGDDRGWGGWMTSPIQWTWDWVSSGSWWWTGEPGMLQSMESQIVGYDWVTELNWNKLVTISPVVMELSTSVGWQTCWRQTLE